MDSNIYKRPLVWDPTRYLPERAEDKKTEHGFLGWGSGLHPCRESLFCPSLHHAMLKAKLTIP